MVANQENKLLCTILHLPGIQHLCGHKLFWALKDKEGFVGKHCEELDLIQTMNKQAHHIQVLGSTSHLEQLNWAYIQQDSWY